MSGVFSTSPYAFASWCLVRDSKNNLFQNINTLRIPPAPRQFQHQPKFDYFFLKIFTFLNILKWYTTDVYDYIGRSSHRLLQSSSINQLVNEPMTHYQGRKKFQKSSSHKTVSTKWMTSGKNPYQVPSNTWCHRRGGSRHGNLAPGASAPLLTTVFTKSRH